MDIAKQNSIELEEYEIKNVVVKESKVLFLVFAIVFFCLFVFFLTYGLLNLDVQNLLIACIVFSCVFLIASVMNLLEIFSFKLAYKDDKLIYNYYFKKRVVNVSDIQSVKVSKVAKLDSYKIEINNTGKKIKYEIGAKNKENITLLLNLQKQGIEQID